MYHEMDLQSVDLKPLYVYASSCFVPCAQAADVEAGGVMLRGKTSRQLTFVTQTVLSIRSTVFFCAQAAEVEAGGVMPRGRNEVEPELEISPESRLHQFIEWLSEDGGDCMIVLDGAHTSVNSC